MVKLLPLFKKERECGTCTKCCEGWNVFNIQGKSIKPGKPCSFVEEGKGCTIYKGNYISTSDKKPDVKTGKTYTDDKGVVYDVYLNSKSKPYVIRKSKKTGKEYKQYLKLES